MQSTELDPLDRALLALLQRDGRITNAEMARRVNLSPPAVLVRVRRLEELGVIRRYVALLAPAALGFDMLCFLQVTLQRHGPAEVEAFRMAVRAMPEVLECHHVTGEYDYLLKVAIRNRQDLERFVVHRLTPAPGVARIHTSLVLSEIKNETALPVE
jgi:Lrp/AsnC family transcriptional regulator, leucine-responsive regulatory protein